MIKVTEAQEKITPAKRTIVLKNILVDCLKFVDEENGDITAQVLDAIPEFVKTVDFKITVDLEEE